MLKERKLKLSRPEPPEPPAVLRKNGIYEINIEDVDAEGFGVGRVNNFTVFVADALPGDRLRTRLLKIKPRYAYGKIEKILKSSPHRITGKPEAIAPDESRSFIVPCPVAARCGGCQFQHSDYAAQLMWKKKMVTDALTRIGRVEAPPVMEVIGMDNPYHYRNKAQFPVGPDADGRGTAIGFYAPRSHRIVPVTHCNIQHPSHESVLNVVRAYMARYRVEPYDEASHQGLLRHVVIKAAAGTPDSMVALVINGRTLPHEQKLAAELTAAGATTVIINSHTERTNVVIGKHSRVLTGDGYIREYVGDIVYRLSVHSFFQVNPVQTKILYDAALALGGFTGAETAIDAHAGVGGVALYAAHAARYVYGVEIVPEAVADAKFNAEHNHLKNVCFIQGAAETVIPALLADGGQWAKEAVPADIILLDPPRKGCGAELLQAVIKAQIPKVVYISCDPATLARDIRLLREGGYTLEKVQPVDMFPMTGKVECVALLTIK